MTAGQTRARSGGDGEIVIVGACEHNLKNVTVSIPKKRLVVVTGPSGSGKSSLAFDTLFAEGQRRYVESLSSYARQFLGQMEKPKYERIRGLSPTIAIEQKAASNNPRSTVGTVTEIYDYLRVLYARLGEQHCHRCGKPARAQTAEQIAHGLAALPQGTKVELFAPLVRGKKGEHEAIVARAIAKGFSRLRVDGRVVDTGAEPVRLDKKSKHDVDAVIDRIVIKAGLRDRITDSVELALREGGGVMIARENGVDRICSEQRACHDCGLSFEELSPQSFSFNAPLGACPTCDGLGSRPEMDPELIVTRPEASIKDGAIAVWAASMARGEGYKSEWVESVLAELGVPADVPFRELPKASREALMWGRSGRSRAWEGLAPMLMRRYKSATSDEMRAYYTRYLSDKPCRDCDGRRLRAESRAVTIAGVSLDALTALTLDHAHAFLQGLALSGEQAEIASELKKELLGRLTFLLDVGLEYLTLSRASATLSGGESQRIRLASQIGSELEGVIYVLDEPSIGLHPRDNHRLLLTLQRLRDLGNTVVVVEHDEETMREADWIIDFGPGAGELGGQVVGEGTPQKLMAQASSVTGAFLSGRRSIAVPTRRRAGSGKSIVIQGAREHNLKGDAVTIPLGKLVCVTGVSGAGKSTLINRILHPALARALHDGRAPVGAHDAIAGLGAVGKVIGIDQQPIGRTPRSNPATYTKLWDHVRGLFSQTAEARKSGYGPGRFSFNVKGGRCEACGGDGLKTVEMHFLPDVYVTCDVCQGRRFNDATLRVKYKNKSIADVLAMSVTDALELFSVHRDISRALRTLEEVGLGYLRLGQSSPTLSGGEAQRIKLARELSRVATGDTLYILDEPTTGLHFGDVERLLAVLGRLVDAGNTVLVIEHHVDVIKSADWLIDIGPEGGDRGGHLVACGTPEHVATVQASHTGRALAGVLGRAPKRR